MLIAPTAPPRAAAAPRRYGPDVPWPGTTRQDYELAQAMLPRLQAAASAHNSGLAAGTFDRESLAQVQQLGSTLLDRIGDMSAGRYPISAEQRTGSVALARASAATFSDVGQFWAMPPEGMKALVNVRAGAASLRAAADLPDVDFKMTQRGAGSLARVSNGLRQLWWNAPPGSALHGAGYRVVGDARAIGDAFERLTNGLTAARDDAPFRASKQLETSIIQLRGAADEADEFLPGDMRRALDEAIAGALAVTDLRGATFPRGADAYIAAIEHLREIAGTSRDALDRASTPFLEGPDGAALRAWREHQVADEDGYYHDADIGWS